MTLTEDEFLDSIETRPAPGGTETDRLAEDALIGALLLTGEACRRAIPLLVPADFYSPTNRRAFEAIAAVYGRGDPVDVVTVAAENEHLDPGDLLRMQLASPAAANVEAYVEPVVRAASGRLLIAQLEEARDDAMRRTVDPGEIAEGLLATLRDVASGSLVRRPEGLATLAEYVTGDEAELSPWTIPGLIRRQWRVMVVAGEGVGKTTLFRQLGITAALGRHPFTDQVIDPVRVLIVDLENPADAILEVCRPMLAFAEKIFSTWDRDRLWILHRPAGLNVRVRSGRAALEAAIREARPDVVVAGPLYKLARKKAREDREDVALEAQEILDDLRTRYRFALMLEHHAPFGRSDKAREMRPADSSVWLRWPDVGLGLERVKGEPREFRLTRFRGDRLRNAWPRTIGREAAMVGSSTHSGGWPWRAIENTRSQVAEEIPAGPIQPSLVDGEEEF